MPLRWGGCSTGCGEDSAGRVFTNLITGNGTQGRNRQAKTSRESHAQTPKKKKEGRRRKEEQCRECTGQTESYGPALEGKKPCMPMGEGGSGGGGGDSFAALSACSSTDQAPPTTTTTTSARWRKMLFSSSQGGDVALLPSALLANHSDDNVAHPNPPGRPPDLCRNAYLNTLGHPSPSYLFKTRPSKPAAVNPPTRPGLAWPAGLFFPFLFLYILLFFFS